MAQEQSNIVKTFSPITVDSVADHTQNEKKIAAGIQNVQVRQVVTSTYPSMNVKGGGLFSVDEFDVKGQEFTSTRVSWFDAPAGTTQAQIEELLAAKPNARIVATYSNVLEDVLDAGQKAAIKNELRTREFFENKLRIKDGNGNDLPGQPQYRNYAFNANGGADVDVRTFKGTGSNDANVTTELVTEAAGGQKVI